MHSRYRDAHLLSISINRVEKNIFLNVPNVIIQTKIKKKKKNNKKIKRNVKRKKKQDK